MGPYALWDYYHSESGSYEQFPYCYYYIYDNYYNYHYYC